MSFNPDQQITKAEFKVMYFKHALPNSGWTETYWNKFYENENDKLYYYAQPETPASTSMFIISDNIKHRMVFLNEDAEESFFDFPGKE